MADIKLKINDSNTFRVCLESLDQFEESAFRLQYIKASEALIKIITYGKSSVNKENKKNKEDTTNDTNVMEDDDYNNMIAFVGERGSGKTSTMMNFGNSLKCDSREKLSEIHDNDLKSNYEKIYHGRKYDVLNIVDPSLFCDGDSIVEIVVAQMFKRITEMKDSRNYLQKQELIKKFESVYEDLRTINQEKSGLFNEISDNLEVLDKLASATNLKRDMKELIECYLKYVNNNGDQYFLVIPIDDLDMNITAGEKMMEDIRKYLISPQVVILMAVKLEQLQEIVKQRNVLQLKELINYSNHIGVKKENIVLDAFEQELENKTYKYLEKLIPYNRRIDMPNLLDATDLSVEITFNEDTTTIKSEEKETLKDLIIRLFKEKLNYFMITPNHFDAVMPNNLRGIIDLIYLFNSMESINEEDISKKMNTLIYENIRKENIYYQFYVGQNIGKPQYKACLEYFRAEYIIENISKIKKYYLNLIEQKICNAQLKAYIHEVFVCNIKTVNRKILLMLNELLVTDQRAKEIYGISDIIEVLEAKKNQIIEENVGYGDVISWIKLYEQLLMTDEERAFIELIKFGYSLRLIEACYNMDAKELLNITELDLCGLYFVVTANVIYRTYVKNKSMSNLGDYLYFSSEEYDRLPDEVKKLAIIDDKTIEYNDKSYYKFKRKTLQKNIIELKNLTIEKYENKEISNKENSVVEQLDLILEKINKFYQILNYSGSRGNKNINKFLRRKGLNEFNAFGKTNFDRFSWQPFNMIAGELYKGIVDDENIDIQSNINILQSTSQPDHIESLFKQNEKCLYVANIDYFMQLLWYVDRKLQNISFDDTNDYKDIISRIGSQVNKIHKQLVKDYHLMDSTNEEQNDSDCDKKLIDVKEQCKEFISDNIKLMRKYDKKLKIINEIKKSLEDILKYINGLPNKIVIPVTMRSKKGKINKIKKEFTEQVINIIEDDKIKEKANNLVYDYINKLEISPQMEELFQNDGLFVKGGQNVVKELNMLLKEYLDN